MATTSPDNVFSPDSANGYDLTTDLAALADSVQDGLNNVRTDSGAFSVANAAARDVRFPTPSQGDRVWRQDLGYEETYYGVHDSTTNPGGLVSAGWYPPVKMFSARRANAQTINSGWNVVTSAWGSPAINHLGTWSSGALTIIKQGWYEIIFGVHYLNASTPGAIQVTKNSTSPDTANTLSSDLIGDSTTALRTVTTALLARGDVIRGLVYSNTGSNGLAAQPYGAELSLRLVNG